MRLGKGFNNMPIITMDEGRLIGKVTDLYINDTLEIILGLHLGTQGLIRRKAEIIRSGDVVVFGVDAILVSTADVVTDDGSVPGAKEWMRREKLVGREVDTPGGTRLGVIGDVVVDTNGAIAGFALSRVFVEGPLAEKRYVDRTTVIDTGALDGRMTIDLPKLEAILSRQEEKTNAPLEGIGETLTIDVDDSTPDQP